MTRHVTSRHKKLSTFLYILHVMNVLYLSILLTVIGATVGVAMGAGGTAMACAAADIVMMSDNLTRLPTTIKLCKLARAIIIQNCVFSIVVKIVAVVLAVAG